MPDLASTGPYSYGQSMARIVMVDIAMAYTVMVYVVMAFPGAACRGAVVRRRQSVLPRPPQLLDRRPEIAPFF